MTLLPCDMTPSFRVTDLKGDNSGHTIYSPRVRFFGKIRIRIFESYNGFCVALLRSMMQDHSDHGVLKEPTNPCQELIQSLHVVCYKFHTNVIPSGVHVLSFLEFKAI